MTTDLRDLLDRLGRVRRAIDRLAAGFPAPDHHPDSSSVAPDPGRSGTKPTVGDAAGPPRRADSRRGVPDGGAA